MEENQQLLGFLNGGLCYEESLNNLVNSNQRVIDSLLKSIQLI